MSDAAFAAVALLRCRDRVGDVLDAVAEPRRSELAAAIAKLQGLADVRLQAALAEVVRHDDAALRLAVVRALDGDIAKAPRIVRQWIARSARR